MHKHCQDMNGTVFMLYQYRDWYHYDVVFKIKEKMYRAICSCSEADQIELREVSYADSYSYLVAWEDTKQIILVEHIKEYIYSGHNSLTYRTDNQKLIENELHL